MLRSALCYNNYAWFVDIMFDPVLCKINRGWGAFNTNENYDYNINKTCCYDTTCYQEEFPLVLLSRPGKNLEVFIFVNQFHSIVYIPLCSPVGNSCIFVTFGKENWKEVSRGVIFHEIPAQEITSLDTYCGV